MSDFVLYSMHEPHGNYLDVFSNMAHCRPPADLDGELVLVLVSAALRHPENHSTAGQPSSSQERLLFLLTKS